MMGNIKIDLPDSCHKLKTILVNPRHMEWGNTPPLGIAYLAAVLEDNCLSVNVIDMSAYGMEYEELTSEIRTIKPDIIGISATTPQMPVGLEVAKIAKSLNPNCITVFGGVHPSSLPDESMSYPEIDMVIRGEGELTLLSLIKQLGTDKHLDNVEGLSYKKDGQVVHNPARPLIENLDDLPLPARHLFPFPEAYEGVYLKRKIFADIMTSRGCIGTCLFCNRIVFGRTVRCMSPEYVVAEMEHLVNNYNVGEIHIADDLFAYDIDRAMKICDLIVEKNLDIVWSASGGVRIDGYTKELMTKMKEAGCYRVHFGVEAGSDEVLRKIGKGITKAQVVEAVNDAKKENMVVVAMFMLGNYGETEKTMRETIDFAKSLNIDFAQFMMAVPFPGTAFYRLLDKRNELLTKDWTKYEIYQEPIYKTEDLNQELVVRMYRKAHREFYFRPRYILGRLKTLKSWGEFRAALIGGLKILQRTITRS
ncbi:B12-binding domain-containing radical SAM protein [Chloroflexota bacterium]